VSAGVVMAAWRDASWFNHPGTAHRFHVVAGDWMAACNTQWCMLAEFTGQAASEVPGYLRCQRPGCKSRWPQGGRS